MDHLLDEALLVVTELVTNAVVHAGTTVELRLDTTGPGLRGEVLDQGGGVLPLLPGTPACDDNREGGRGLFLLDALATSWGTTHAGSAKSVWFLLDAEHEEPRTVPKFEDSPTGAIASVSDLAWLVELPDRLQQQLPAQQLSAELLHRTTGTLGVRGATLLTAGTDSDDVWLPSAVSGAGLDDEQRARVRRLAADSDARTFLDRDLAVFPLHGTTGTIGALVLLPDHSLGATERALARLVADRISGTLNAERIREAGRRNRGSLSLLAEASDMFAGSLDAGLALTLLAQLVVPRFGRWAAVFDVTGQMPELLSVTHADEDEAPALRAQLTLPDMTLAAVSIAERLQENRTTLLSGRTLPPGLSARLEGDLLAVPLIARRKLIGVLLLSPSGSGNGADDVSLLLDLGRRAAVAVDAARLYEERNAVAQALQASLLPPALPDVGHVRFGARYAAAGEGNQVGGDFYDVFPVDDQGGWAVAIGDVCGKGAEAAAITGLARNVLRMFIQERMPPEQVFGRLNDAILELGPRGRFCTTTLGVFRPSAAGLEVRIVSAGHPPAVHVRADGEACLLPGGGTLLGVVEDIEVAVEHLTLLPGDQLVFYTDGVTERRQGAEWFGEHNLLQVLRRTAGRAPDVVAGSLVESVRSFASAATSDDLAVVVVSAPAPPRLPSTRSSSSDHFATNSEFVSPRHAIGTQ